MSTIGATVKYALDLFCGAGGATRGLQMAGFTVHGMDIRDQPNYCGDLFIEDDAVTSSWPIDRYDFIWASPPCQRFTRAQRLMKNEHPDLIEPIRKRLQESGVPYCIENVRGAPLKKPIQLCGAMFPGLRVYRHRLFECSFPVEQPLMCDHSTPLRKMGRRVLEGEFMHVVGNFVGLDIAREAMGIDWMNRDEIREAIPPAFSEYIGKAVVRHLTLSKLAAE